MKLRIVLVILALSFSSLTWAQVSRESYEKAVDFLNCKSVELSLKSTNNYNKFQTECPCSTASYNQINSFLTAAAKLSATLALSQEIENLKEEFDQNWQIESATSFLTDTIFLDNGKYKKINEFIKNRKNIHLLSDYKAILRNELPSLLKNPQANRAAKLTSNDKQQYLRAGITEYAGSQEEETESWFNGIIFQIILISIIISTLFALIIFLFISKTIEKNDKKLPSVIKKYVEEKRSNQSLRERSEINPIEVKKLKDDFKKLREEFEKLREDMKILGFKSIPMEIILPKDEKAMQVKIEEPEIKPEIFFISTPNSDGSFSESSASTAYKEGASIYRFTKIGTNIAEFHIEEKEASVKLAIQYPELRIDPLCDAENAFDPKATRIITVHPGEAELQGGKWVRNTKAKIRYES